MVSLIPVFALLTAKLFPDLPAGRWCQRYLVDGLMALIGKIKRRHVLFVVFGLIALQAFAIATPMDIAFVAAFDVATYVDILLAVGTIAAVTRSRMLWTALCYRVSHVPTPRLMQRTRARRQRQRASGPRRALSANDGEPAAPALLIA